MQPLDETDSREVLRIRLERHELIHGLYVHEEYGHLYKAELLVDSDVSDLVSHLDGLPLALATAGDYLRQTAISFAQYLRFYSLEWDKLTSRTLHDYADERDQRAQRTLFATWNISMYRIKEEWPEAAKLLRFLGFFDNHEIWFQLLEPACDKIFGSLNNTNPNEQRFHSAMGFLKEHSLVEINRSDGCYSLHTCVHDWIKHYTETSGGTIPGLDHCLAISCTTQPALRAQPDFLSPHRSYSWLRRHAIHVAAQTERNCDFYIQATRDNASTFYDKLNELAKMFSLYPSYKEDSQVARLMLHRYHVYCSVFGFEDVRALSVLWELRLMCRGQGLTRQVNSVIPAIEAATDQTSTVEGLRTTCTLAGLYYLCQLWSKA